MNLQMTPIEIKDSYIHAIDQRKQVDILTQLNDCRPSVIKKILVEEGVTPAEPRKRAPRKKQKKCESNKEKTVDIVIKALQSYRAGIVKDFEDVKATYEDLLQRIDDSIAYLSQTPVKDKK